jgi:hypothetical protein
VPTWLAAPKMMWAIVIWPRCGAKKVKISADETWFMRGNMALRFAVIVFKYRESILIPAIDLVNLYNSFTRALPLRISLLPN